LFNKRETEVPEPNPRRWLILAVVLMAECMDLLDGTVVNIAAPAIHRDLGASASALQWIVGGYALAIAVGLITGGRLGDIFGRRRMFLIGVGGFTLASLLCGLAPSTGALIASRLLQGAAGAMMLPQGLGLLRESFAGEEMSKVFAMFGPVMGMAALLGPIIGGGLVGLDLFGTGWRLVFLVNLPVGMLALIAGARILPAGRRQALKLDLAGALLTCLAGAAIVYPLIQGRELGWPVWTYVSLALGGLGLVAFAFEQRRRDRHGRDTLVTPSVFGHRGYTLGLVTALFFFAAMIGTMLALTLYLQLGEGFSALHAGLTLVPWSFGAAVGAGLSGGLLGPRLGRIVISAGAAVKLAGFGLVLVALDGSGRVSSWDLVPGLLLAGVGMGLVVAPLFDIILAAVADDELGSGSGVLNAVQQLAGSVGVAVLGTVFFSAIAHGGFAHGLRSTLWVALGLLAAVFALSFWLPRWARDPMETLAGEAATVAA
jgi:EmrB/QacA subfamily drug resistance transporter